MTYKKYQRGTFKEAFKPYLEMLLPGLLLILGLIGCLLTGILTCLLPLFNLTDILMPVLYGLAIFGCFALVSIIAAEPFFKGIKGFREYKANHRTKTKKLVDIQKELSKNLNELKLDEEINSKDLMDYLNNKYNSIKEPITTLKELEIELSNLELSKEKAIEYKHLIDKEKENIIDLQIDENRKEPDAINQEELNRIIKNSEDKKNNCHVIIDNYKNEIKKEEKVEKKNNK